jgi:tetratricopeptide (TPR) repeat protein
VSNQAEAVVHSGQEAVIHAGHHESGQTDRLPPIVAIIIAFTTLVAAVAGFFETNTAGRAAEWRLDAERLSLQALASGQSAQQSAQVELETFERWVEESTQAGNALVASLYAGSGTPAANALSLEEQRWQAIADSTLKLTDIDPQGEYGPEQDPTFPERYLASASQESLRLTALADAADEQANGIDRQVATYTAVLAMLAVSLYLFGLTLAVSGSSLRVGFLTVGVVLLTVSSTWLVQTAAAPASATSDEAAAEYAQARVASMTAHDTAGYQAAEAHYDRAIALRPTFARAYAERAGVIFNAASPQRSGFVSLAPPEALERARADLQHALALGLENAQTLGDLAFYGFAEGVQGHDIALLNESADYTRRAIALDPGEPIYRYNLAVTLVAAGRFDEARAAYQDAVARTIYTDDALTKLRQEPSVEEAWLAGALTDLETVARYRVDLADQIRGFKEQIEGGVTAEQVRPPAGSPASFADVQLDVFPAEVQWQGTLSNYDATRDTISAQWYHQDPAGLGWAVIPEISATVTPSVGNDGRLFVLAPYMSQVSPPACLPIGSYRAEIYINGRLAAQSEVAADFGDYDAFLARDLTMAFCRPHDWVRRDDHVPGLIDGFQSADGMHGAYGARYGLPGSFRSLPDITAQIEDLTVKSFPNLFPANPTYDESSGTTSDYFMGLSQQAWRWYDYGTGYIRIGGGMTADGSVVIGMVYGPYDWFSNTQEPNRILSSMIHVE